MLTLSDIQQLKQEFGKALDFATVHTYSGRREALDDLGRFMTELRLHEHQLLLQGWAERDPAEIERALLDAAAEDFEPQQHRVDQHGKRTPAWRRRVIQNGPRDLAIAVYRGECELPDPLRPETAQLLGRFFWTGWKTAGDVRCKHLARRCYAAAEQPDEQLVIESSLIDAMRSTPRNAAEAAARTRALKAARSLLKTPERPQRDRGVSVQELPVWFGDEVNLAPDPPLLPRQRAERITRFDQRVRSGKGAARRTEIVSHPADEDWQPMLSSHELILDAIASAALERDDEPRIDRLMPIARQKAQTRPPDYEVILDLMGQPQPAIDDLVARCMWREKGVFTATQNLGLLRALRDSCSVELTRERDLAAGNVQTADTWRLHENEDGTQTSVRVPGPEYGLCLYDEDLDASKKTRSAFVGSDPLDEELNLIDGLDPDEDAEWRTRVSKGTMTSHVHMEYEQATGMHIVSVPDPDEVVLTFDRLVMNRTMATAEDRFDVYGMADYLAREDHRQRGDEHRGDVNDRTGTLLQEHSQRSNRIIELGQLHSWASMRISAIEEWKASPFADDFQTVEEYERAYVPDSPSLKQADRLRRRDEAKIEQTVNTGFDPVTEIEWCDTAPASDFEDVVV